jgi:hypothetical protein
MNAPIQLGTESSMQKLGETAEGLNRLYFTPALHISDFLSINDVRPDKAKITKDKCAQR